MHITNHGLEAMGYETMGPSECLRGTFTRIEIFSIQGMALETTSLAPISENINGVRFKLGFGSSLNEVCRQLIENDYVDDEEQWKKDTRSRAPFMILLFGPTDEHIGTGTHFQNHGDIIATYDSFQKAKQELSRQVDAVVPSLLASLSINFANEEHKLSFPHCQSTVSGKTPDGKKILDLKFDISATVIVSRSMHEAELSKILASSFSMAKRIDNDIAHFYYNGLNESDPLKRFLNFFLFIERSIHQTFKKIDHDVGASNLLSQHEHVSIYGKKLFNTQRNSWSDLRSRFIWCIMHKWIHLTDLDGENFDHLKGVRDNISHGAISEPKSEDVAAIEALAVRIQGKS